MRCLTDVDIQIAADGEGGEAIRSHLAACSRCRERVAERRADLGLVARALETAGMPLSTEARIRSAIRTGASGVRGATALRSGPVGPRWRPIGAALAAAAGVLLVVYLVLPHVGTPTTLSASEVLGRSLQTLSATRGIELLEYELTVHGAVAGGTYRIEQLVDYDHPNRFRLAKYAPDGALQSAISQDPFTGRRTHVVRIDGRNYVFNFTAPESAMIPIPELARAQLETVITMMQATADQKLTVVDGGREYVIQIPPVTPRTTGMLDLYQARAVIDGSDFRLREFEASGALLKQPYTVSFRLIRRTLRDPAQVSSRDFEIAAEPDDVVLQAEATPDIFGDLVGTALRELAKSHRR